MIARALILAALLFAPAAYGANARPQVVGGQPAAEGQFPFVVRVYAPGGTCTGSLVRDDWVLTAAHCGNDGIPTQVLIGDAESFVDGPGHVVTKLGVEKWIAHPDYSPLTDANDIALIKLAGKASSVPPRENGTVQYEPRTFVTGLGFTTATRCELFVQNARAFAECSGLSFQQGTCTGDITFGWQNGKQSFEVVEGCH